MKKLFQVCVFFCTVWLVSAMDLSASNGSRSGNAARIAALYSKRVFTGNSMPGTSSQQQRHDSLAAVARRATADSSRPNRIVSIRENNSGLYQLELDISENQQNLQIGIFNLLGKRVLDVHQGAEYAGRSRMYDMNVQSIPNGIYVCIVQGDNFRLAEKFYISR